MPLTRIWSDAVVSALERQSARRASVLVTRRALVEEELPTIVAETRSVGATPAQTLSRVLQELRDDGVVEFLASGEYRLLQAPVDVTQRDLGDEELDTAVRKRQLRFPDVNTDSVLVAARRRRGQDRIRALTLASYGSQCAVCDEADPFLLVASHIVPWSESVDARGDLANVLCLCFPHDRLFEIGYWTLTDDLTPLRRTDRASRFMQMILDEVGPVRLPSGPAPSLRYLLHHRVSHGFESREALAQGA